MSKPLRVLVTGAEEHQGLAAVRGLGMAGVEVLASGARRGPGFYSRYAAKHYRYRSPLSNPSGFVTDLLQIADRTRPDVILPVVESTLVALDPVRDRLPRGTALAAPATEALNCAVDKLKTVCLARQVGVPVPATATGDTPEQLLKNAAGLQFPLALKPRGHARYTPTAHGLSFKVRYARDRRELERYVAAAGADASRLLVQEYAPGIGRCVAALYDQGRPLALLAYERVREWPLTGGISVMRRTIPLNFELRSMSAILLESLRWTGPAMVEFKYQPAGDRYVLMEVNGRLQASTALAVDAGVNLPYLTTLLFAGREVAAVPGYAVGVEERWLRGDLMALLRALEPEWIKASGPPSRSPAPLRLRALAQFAADFRPGVKYDEFRLGDWRPGLVEMFCIGGEALTWLKDLSARLVYRGAIAARKLASSPTQRSMRSKQSSKKAVESP